jgi:phosphinothricin acetyltransferase
MKTDIRDAVLDDAAAIADIYNQAVLHSTATFDTQPQSVEEREAWMTAHGSGHPVIVAAAAGRVVGWGSLSRFSTRPAYDRTAEVSTYIDEAWRGNRIGTTLTEALVERAAALGMHALVARICVENEASLRMVERLGFERVGVLREVGEKFGRLLDVVMLERLL